MGGDSLHSGGGQAPLVGGGQASSSGWRTGSSSGWRTKATTTATKIMVPRGVGEPIICQLPVVLNPETNQCEPPQLPPLTKGSKLQLMKMEAVTAEMRWRRYAKDEDGVGTAR